MCLVIFHAGSSIVIRVKRVCVWVWIGVIGVIGVIVRERSVRPTLDFSDELGLGILPEDVINERLVVSLVTFANELGVVIHLEDISDEFGLGMPLTALAVSIGCSNIRLVLRREDDVMTVTQHRQDSEREK